MRMSTNSVPTMALIRVKTLARTISPKLRPGDGGTALTRPSRTRSATSADESPNWLETGGDGIRSTYRWVSMARASVNELRTLKTPPPLQVGSQVEFVARFLGRTLRYTYEFAELISGERLVMRTQQGPFPMETTYTWGAESDGSNADDTAQSR